LANDTLAALAGHPAVHGLTGDPSASTRRGARRSWLLYVVASDGTAIRAVRQ